MYDEPTEFTNFKDRSGALQAVILRVHIGSDRWFFGNVEMDIANNEDGDTSTYHVYPLFDFDGIVESIDSLRKTWTGVCLGVTIHNLPYRIDSSGDWVRPHDDLADLSKGNEVYLYLVAGPNVASLDDCLLRFYGIVAGNIVLDGNKLSFACADRSRLYRVFLPDTLVESVWPSCPEDSRGKRIPIFYGDFDQDFSAPATHNGLIRGVRVQEAPPKWVFGIATSDVTLYMGSAGRARWYFEGDNITWAVTSSYKTGQQNAVDGIYRGSVILPLNETVEASLYYNRTSYPVVNPVNAHDDTTAEATVQDNHTDDGGNMIGVAAWGIDDSDLLQRLILDESANVRILCQFRNIDWSGGITGTIMSLGLMFGPTGRPEYNSLRSISMDDLGQSGWYNIEPIMASSFAQDIFANAIHFMFSAATTGGGDSTKNNQDICTIDELRVKVESNITTWTDAWYEGTGQAEDNAPDIIRDILEQYCNVPSALILNDHFDYISTQDRFFAPMHVYLHSGNAGYSDAIIRQIIEQSNFTFCWNALSQPKCIRVIWPTSTGSPPSTTTIVYADVEGSIRVTKSDFIINRLKVFSRWQEEFGAYYDTDAFGSGAASMEVRWKFVNNTSYGYGGAIDNLGQWLITDSDALWKNPWIIVEFETKGFKYASLEIGDHIELDYTTFDPRLKAFGESWQDKRLMVVGLTQRADSTRIKAIEMHLTVS